MSRDITRLGFDSSLNYMKRDTSSDTAIIDTAVSTTLPIAHNLGYVPQYEVAAELDEADTIWVGGKVSELTDQGFLSGLGSPPTYIEIDSWCTTTTLTISLSNTAGQKIPVRYIIYLDYAT